MIRTFSSLAVGSLAFAALMSGPRHWLITVLLVVAVIAGLVFALPEEGPDER